MFSVALIGRPNVGKSSLFNALLGFRRSIVFDQPGTTVDIVSEKAPWGNIQLLDTQGAFSEGDTKFLRDVLDQADAVLFVVDALVGRTPFDEWIAKEINFVKKPTLLLINKADAKGGYREDEFARFPFEEAITVSSAHRTNIEYVKEWCLNQAPSEGPEDGYEPVFRFAIVGRPNTGKSTLMNRLCGEDVSRVSAEPHTTRDPVSYELETQAGRVKIIDTAGMRRPRSKKTGIETFSIQATTRTIRESDVICLCINASEALTDQDMRLLNLVVREGRPVMILLNMWDKLTHEKKRDFFALNELTNYLETFKTLEISAKTGANCDRILPTVKRLYSQSQKRITTSKLNRLVETLVKKNPPPVVGRKSFNLLYASQVRVDPPAFVFFMNRSAVLPKSYKLYLTNQLRDRLGLKSQAFRIYFREADR
jgi:GTPase